MAIRAGGAGRQGDREVVKPITSRPADHLDPELKTLSDDLAVKARGAAFHRGAHAPSCASPDWR